MSDSVHTPQIKKSRKTITHILRHPVVITVAVLCVTAVGVYALLHTIESAGQRINRSQYQAVYTASGQLFFGKLQSTDGVYLTLQSPYTAQTSTADSAEQTTQDTTTLVKVQDQKYGPEDSMAIRADQVMFWQNLRDDSKVTQAIKTKEAE